MASDVLVTGAVTASATTTTIVADWRQAGQEVAAGTSVVKDGTNAAPTVTRTATVTGNTNTSCTTATTTLTPSNATLATGATQVFSATSTACSSPKFQFWLQYPAGTGPWVIKQPFSSGLSTWNWNTAQLTALGWGILIPGQYRIVVWANQSGNPTSHYEAYAQAYVTLTGCGPVSVTVNPTSPQPVGIVVTIKGSTSVCGIPLYAFWMRAKGSTTWQLVQPYGLNDTFTWHTSFDTPADTYYFLVWVKDLYSGGTAGSSLGQWDAYVATKPYVLTTKACTSVTVTCCGPVSVTWSAPSPQPSGTNPVTATATTSGCTSPEFQFWMRASGSSTWTDLFSSAVPNQNILNWYTMGAPAGTYYFSVWVRDLSSPGAAGNSLGRWDAYFATSYVLTTAHCTSVSVTSSPPGTAPAGTQVTIGTSATTCPFPNYEIWMLDPGGSRWTQLTGYGYGNSVASNPLVWRTAVSNPKGLYHFSVWVKDSGSTGTAGDSLGRWDTYTVYSYTLT